MTKELLAVLDMPEKEQLAFLENYPNRTIDDCKVLVQGNWKLLKSQLASLAFRLRDEVYKDEKCTPILRKCMQVVTARAYGLFGDEELWETWWTTSAQPIHWVIAALIARELSNENKG